MYCSKITKRIPRKNSLLPQDSLLAQDSLHASSAVTGLCSHCRILPCCGQSYCGWTSPRILWHMPVDTNDPMVYHTVSPQMPRPRPTLRWLPVAKMDSCAKLLLSARGDISWKRNLRGCAAFLPLALELFCSFCPQAALGMENVSMCLVRNFGAWTAI